jgi:hypothetical protein
MTTHNTREESREAYAERYLLGRLFEIVRFYNREALANPPVVRKAVEDIITTLITPHHQELQKEREEERERIIALVKDYYKNDYDDGIRANTIAESVKEISYQSELEQDNK